MPMFTINVKNGNYILLLIQKYIKHIQIHPEKIGDILVPSSICPFYLNKDQLTPKENISENYNNNYLDSNHAVKSSPKENDNDKKSEIELKLKKSGTYNVEEEIALLNNMISVENSNSVFIKARNYLDHENIRNATTYLCNYNYNNHLETVRETISENSGSKMESSIILKKSVNENENIEKSDHYLEYKTKKESEYDKNNINNCDYDISISTEHNHIATDKFKLSFGNNDFFIHKSTKKTSSDIKTD